MFNRLWKRSATAEPSASAPPSRSTVPAPTSTLPATGTIEGSALRIGVLSSLGTFDPALAEDSVQSLIFDQAYETLYAPPLGDAPATPLLARGPVEQAPSRTGAIYRVPLKEGITFSDGILLTTSSVVASFERLADFRRRGIRVRANGDNVEFELPEPNPNFVLALTQTNTAIVRSVGSRFVGTGPYIIPAVSLDALAQSGDPLVLTRNSNAHQHVAIGALAFHAYPDIAALTAAISNGDIDYTDVIPFEIARKLDRSRLRLSIQKGHSTGFLAINVERVQDPLVRRVLFEAIDRTEIASRNFEGLAIGYVAGSLLPPMVAIPERGMANGVYATPATLPKSLTLLMTWGPKVYLPHPTETAHAIRDQLGRIGVDVRIHSPRSRTEYLEMQECGAYDLILAGWIADTPDPSDFYESMLMSSSVPQPGVVNVMGNNVARVKSITIDQLLREFRRNPNEETNAHIARAIAHEGLYLPLLHGKVIAVYTWSLRGLAVSPLGRTLFASAER